MINKVYSTVERFAVLAYDKVLEVDREMAAIREDAPRWMRDDHQPLPADAGPWVDWQRKAYILSASHKVIVLHRPYLGRAFKNDSRYAHSKETCLEHARTILRIFIGTPLQQFRTTWTCLVHAVAASLILLLDAAQRPQDDEAFQTVREVLDILHQYSFLSVIAKKGVRVLSLLVDRATVPGRPEFSGKAEAELQRALDFFRRS